MSTKHRPPPPPFPDLSSAFFLETSSADSGYLRQRVGISNTVDLRGVTRNSSRVNSRVRLSDSVPWIEAGELEIVGDPARAGALVEVGARFGGTVTDPEHDSAWAFRFSVSGLAFVSYTYGWTHLSAVISGGPESLRVPWSSDYDPAKLPGSKMCDCGKKRGEPPHLVVPEGFYAGPPQDQHSLKRWCLLVGRRVEISYGPAPGKDESDE